MANILIITITILILGLIYEAFKTIDSGKKIRSCDAIYYSLILCIFSSVITITFIAIVEDRMIPPIDVYRGYTRLKITYTVIDGDTTNIDSTVIYKK